MGSPALADGQQFITVTNHERHKTKCQHRMIQRRPEILPQGRVVTGIVGREKQKEHVDESERAGDPHPDSQHQTQANCQFPIRDDKCDGRGMRKNKVLQDRHHLWISAALVEELVDPPLKSAVQRELRSKNFILGKDQEKAADSDTQNRERDAVSVGGSAG